MKTFKNFLLAENGINGEPSIKFNEDNHPDHVWSDAELENQRKHRISGHMDHDAHNSYKDDSHDFVNRHLRNGYSEGNDHIEVRESRNLRRIHEMDTVTHHPTVEPMTTYRGFAPTFQVHHMKPGDTFTDHGYTGTTTTKHTAWSFAGLSKDFARHKTVAAIHIPAGTHGHLLDHPDFPDTSSHDENEFTLHRGTTFQVHKHSTHQDEHGNMYHMIHLHVVGQHPLPVKVKE